MITAMKLLFLTTLLTIQLASGENPLSQGMASFRQTPWKKIASSTHCYKMGLVSHCFDRAMTAADLYYYLYLDAETVAIQLLRKRHAMGPTPSPSNTSEAPTTQPTPEEVQIENHEISSSDPSMSYLLPSCNLSTTIREYREWSCLGAVAARVALNFDEGCFMIEMCNKADHIFSPGCRQCISGTGQGVKIYDTTFCQIAPDSMPPEVPQNMDYCSVGELVIRDCSHPVEQMSEIRWAMVRGKVIILDEETWQGVHETRIYEDFNCTSSGLESCSKEKCAAGKCDGSPMFCETFRCSRGSQCHCAGGEGVVHKVWIGDHVITPRCWGRSWIQTVREGSTTRPLVDIACPECKASCTKEEVKVEAHFRPMESVKICLNGLCKTQKASGDVERVPLVKAMSDPGGLATVEVSFLHGGRKLLTTQCPEVPMCERITCSFCKSAFLHPQCFPIQLPLTLFFFALMAYLLYKRFAAVRILMYLMWSVLTWPFRLMFTRRPYQPLRQENRAQARRRLLAAGLMSMLSLGSCCSEIGEMHTTQRDCSIVDGRVRCTINGVLRVSLAPIGQESCILMRGPRAELSEMIRIKTTGAELRCDPALLYWVPQPSAKCVATKECNWVGQCVGKTCIDWEVTSSRAEWGSANDQLGESACSPSCGCWGCGCFSCASACLFHRAYLVNHQKEAARVFTCSAWRYWVQLTITVGGKSAEVEVGLGSRIKTSFGSIAVLGVSTPQIPALSQCFMEMSGHTAAVDCAAPGQPMQGLVGEVQCPSYQDAGLLRPPCIMARHLVEATPAGEGVQCRSSLLDINHLLRSRALPLETPVGTVIKSGNSVTLQSGAGLVVDLEAKVANHRIDVIEDKSLCSLTFVKLEGCSDCLPGARATLDAQAKGGAVKGTVSCDSGWKTAIFISEKRSEMVMHYRTSETEVDDVCKVECPGNTVSIRLKGHLGKGSLEDMRDLTGHSVHVSPGGGVDPAHVWEGLLAWWRTFRVAIIAAAVGAIMVLVLVIIWKLKSKKHD